MNERSVHPITSARPAETGVHSKISVSDREEIGIAREGPAMDTNRLVQKNELVDDFAKNLANISIHFSVDEETNQVIVVVTERRSGRVVRTIPASELENMQAGDLLMLSA